MYRFEPKAARHHTRRQAGNSPCRARSKKLLAATGTAFSNAARSAGDLRFEVTAGRSLKELALPRVSDFNDSSNFKQVTGDFLSASRRKRRRYA
jgi:hypothetical protein